MTVKELAVALKEAFDFGSDLDQALDYVHIKYRLSAEDDITTRNEELEELVEKLQGKLQDISDIVDRH